MVVISGLGSEHCSMQHHGLELCYDSAQNTNIPVYQRKDPNGVLQGPAE